MTADIEKIISDMSLADKIALCSGADLWHTKAVPDYRIPHIMMTDGPSGLRKQDNSADAADINNSVPATCFPAASLAASSWDESIIFRIGSAIAEEALSENVSLVLGPGANIKRNPLCGRNFEYFSEDPYLTGHLAAAYINGMRYVGTDSCLKHFACNNQENGRYTSNSILSERALREIYLTGFEIAVRDAHPSTVMCAYNKINGTYCSDNRKLLTDILRDEWGFDGTVITDWGALSNRISAFKAGCDLNMPGGSSYMEKSAMKAVKKGTLDETDINSSVRRILQLVLKENDIPPAQGQIADHNAFAAHAASESAVLLKNEGNILPLSKKDNIVLIGAMARHMRYQGSGSSHVNPLILTNPIDAMPDLRWAQGCLDNGDTDETLLTDAAAAAAEADVAVVFAGLPDSYESEGFDRSNMKMPSGHLKMIGAVCNANPNTVVVLMCGSPVECPWADHVKGILYMGLSGQAGGEAVRRILYGEVNPSGKLAESWPYEYADCISSSYYDKEGDALYLEDIYVGYRYYDSAHVDVRWPFGYGLSYTSFEYSDLNVENETVSVKITNTGTEAGSEVVQMYIVPIDPIIHRPEKELKGFSKVYLEPGESTIVTFGLDNRSFAIWQKGWIVPSGMYIIRVGTLDEYISVAGDEPTASILHKKTWYDSLEGIPSESDLEFAIGEQIVHSRTRVGEYTMNSSIEEMKDSCLAMKILFRSVSSYIRKHSSVSDDPEDPKYKMMVNTTLKAPLRTVQMFSSIKDGIIIGLLKMANGHFFRGIARMLKG